MAKTSVQQKTDDDSHEPSFADYNVNGADSELVLGTARLLTALATEKRLDVTAVENIVAPVFVDLRANPVSQLCWYYPGKYPDYRPVHALNACRLAMYFGHAGGMDDARTVQLGMIGLLYDTGMWMDGMGVALEARALTGDETTRVEAHTTRGADLLRQVKDVDPLCARVAAEHHERVDGSGYPARLKADAQHPYSRLFQMIDSYLGMIGPRAFRKANNPVEALQRIAVQAQRNYFHAPSFRDWLKVMGVYPVGSFVTLNTGELALVSHGGGDNPRRPRVMVLADELLDFRSRPMDLDLSQESAFEIQAAFTKFPRA